jgi:hypothetical protein
MCWRIVFIYGNDVKLFNLNRLRDGTRSWYNHDRTLVKGGFQWRSRQSKRLLSLRLWILAMDSCESVNALPKLVGFQHSFTETWTLWNYGSSSQLAKVQNLGLFYFCYILTSKIPLVFLIFTYLLMIQICFTLIRVYWHWKPLVTNKFHMFTNGYVQTSHHSIEKSNYTIFQPVQKKVNYQMKVSLNGHLLKQDFSKVSIKIKWNIGAISHRWIFIFFTGVVPETLGGEQVRQDKASLNPREAYTLGVDCGATRGRLESRKQSTPTPRSVQKVVLCKKMNQRVTLHKLILWLNYTNIL